MFIVLIYKTTCTVDFMSMCERLENKKKTFYINVTLFKLNKNLLRIKNNKVDHPPNELYVIILNADLRLYVIGEVVKLVNKEVKIREFAKFHFKNI